MKEFLQQQRREKREKRKEKEERKLRFAVADEELKEGGVSVDGSAYSQSIDHYSISSGSGSSRSGTTSETSVLKQLY